MDRSSEFNDLIRVLLQAGLPPDAEAFADALWLAEFQPLTPARVRRTEERRRVDSSSSSASGTAAEGGRRQEDEKPDPEAVKPVSSGPPDDNRLFAGPSVDSGHGYRAAAVQVPTASALPGALDIGRALRPFGRRHVSSHRMVLDEEATAESIAQSGFVRPILRPMKERWFDVALVVDGSRSMDIWSKTVGELELLLSRHGAFGQVRRWRLVVEGNAVTLEAASGRVVPSVLHDPRGRTLVLLATNGVAGFWNGHAIATIIAEWSRRAPVAILQLFSERHWPHTALGPPSRTVRAPMPGDVGAKLQIDRKRWERRLSEKVIAIPILSSAPEAVLRWAEATMAVGVNNTPAVVFLRDATVETIAAGSGESAAAGDAHARVEQFRCIASAEAFRLASYLSAVPLTLPIMRIVQQQMSSAPRLEHLAEVMASGLVERVTPAGIDVDPEMVLYDFAPDVRDVLLNGVLMSAAFDVRTQVQSKLKEFIDRRLGRSIDNFRAFILDEQGDQQLPDDARAFVEVERTLLEKFGVRTAAPVQPTTDSRVRVNPAQLAATAETHGLRVVLEQLHARRKDLRIGELYWDVLTSIRGRSEGWRQWFERLAKPRRRMSRGASWPPWRRNPKVWHEVMWIVAVSLNERRSSQPDALAAISAVLERTPEARDMFQGKTLVERVAAYYAFLHQPSMPDAARIVEAYPWRGDAPPVPEALLPWLRCVRWIALRMVSEDLIAAVEQKSGDMPDPWLQLPAEEAELSRACLFEMERYLPWIQLARAANEFIERSRLQLSTTDVVRSVANQLKSPIQFLDRRDYERLLADREHAGRRVIAYTGSAEAVAYGLSETFIVTLRTEHHAVAQYWGLVAFEHVAPPNVVASFVRPQLVLLRRQLDPEGDAARLLRTILGIGGAVGAVTERQRALTWIDRAGTQGHHPVLVLLGSPGSGKSHMLARIINEAEWKGFQVARVDMYPFFQESADILKSISKQLGWSVPFTPALDLQPARRAIEAANWLLGRVRQSARPLLLTVDVEAPLLPELRDFLDHLILSADSSIGLLYIAIAGYEPTPFLASYRNVETHVLDIEPDQIPIVDDPWDPELYGSLHDGGRYEEAAALCRRVLDEFPEHNESRSRLGHLLTEHLGQLPEAARVLREGIDRAPTDPNLRFFLAEALQRMERFEEAAEELRRAAPYVAPSSRAQVDAALSKILVRTGRYDEAVEQFRESFDQMPDAQAANSFAWALYEHEVALDAAEEIAAKAVELDPAETSSKHTLVAIMVRNHRWDRAVPLIEQWIREVDPVRVQNKWNEFIPTFRDAIRQGHHRALANIARRAPAHPVWHIIVCALDMVEGRSSKASAEIIRLARVVYGQFASDATDVQFPPLVEPEG